MNRFLSAKSASVILVTVSVLAAVFSTVATAAPTTQPAPKLPPHTTLVSDVKYGDGPGDSNLLDVFMPDPAPAQALPLIIWIHGGGWSAGDKQFCPALPAVAHGYIVASINYRLSGQAVYPAQIQDCKGAVRFLRAHAGEYKIDPDKIGVWGASAGGHLVALLGTSADSKELQGTVGGNADQSSKVQAVGDWFGPTDLTQFADQALAAGIIKSTPGPNLIMALFGGGLQEKKEMVTLANPITFISREKAKQIPPFLIMHGDKDKMVPVAQSQLLNDALTAAGVKVDFQIIAGAGHGNGFATPKIAKTVQDFFDEVLKGEKH